MSYRFFFRKTFSISSSSGQRQVSFLRQRQISLSKVAKLFSLEFHWLFNWKLSIASNLLVGLYRHCFVLVVTLRRLYTEWKLKAHIRLGLTFAFCVVDLGFAPF
ncbi:hypothetical protein ES288_A01G128400v1 [Gossypium darwinii]|uniref:Uncharacterized protein n=1 Tax=Gossypium darwinii TaxID=34276 RepID=A0A5D2HLT1_GOSDA|nr:hypothetical protein ES288_A01G128400v1 [Gossypium darwinii]